MSRKRASHAPATVSSRCCWIGHEIAPDVGRGAPISAGYASWNLGGFYGGASWGGVATNQTRESGSTQGMVRGMHSGVGRFSRRARRIGKWAQTDGFLLAAQRTGSRGQGWRVGRWATIGESVHRTGPRSLCDRPAPRPVRPRTNHPSHCWLGPMANCITFYFATSLSVDDAPAVMQPGY